MQPLSGMCGASGGQCIPNPSALRYDDIAALNRMYPLTAQNLAAFPGKQITSANTISIQGTVSFPGGYGMQGVNVVARPLDANGNPLYQYTVSAVTGSYFGGNHGNPVTGFADSYGSPFTKWGSDDATLQGYFDLSAIPLPPGVTTANYQVTFESINPLYILDNSVGPYTPGQVAPSGTLQTVSVPNMSAGSMRTLAITSTGSPDAGFNDAIGTQAQPRPMPSGGLWCGRLSQVNQSDWFTLPIRGNRIFTIVTQASMKPARHPTPRQCPLSASGMRLIPSAQRLSAPRRGLNGLADGETWLRVAANGDDVVRIGIADLRGDGRPDYAYNGWILYADSVSPSRLPASGGPITIQGMGFRIADTVLVGGQPALVTSISPNQITAIAPPAAAGVTGSVDVEVDDLPVLYAAAVIPGGVSYDSGNGDALTLVTAPNDTVPIGVPIPFTVTALGPSLVLAGGVTIRYAVTSGTASLACGLPVCSVTTTGDGRATMSATAIDGTWSVVSASLTNGSYLEAHFAGGASPLISALTPQLSLTAGATFIWTVQALVLSPDSVPYAGQSVSWQSTSSRISVQGPPAALTSAAGIATKTLIVGPLAEGQMVSINACLDGTSQCVAFSAYGARPEYALLEPVSGVTQSLAASGTPSQIVLRLLDMNGNPMAGGTVGLYQAVYAWSPPCAPHTACMQGTLLATQIATAISAVDGVVVFIPTSVPGVATRMLGLGVSGSTATVPIAIDQHP